MTHAEYLRYLQFVHGKLTVDNPVTLRRYVQNHVFDGAFGAQTETEHVLAAPRDSVTELFWDSPDDMRTTFANHDVRTKIGPDGRNFADESLTISIVAEEVEMMAPEPDAGSFKVMHFLKSVPDLAVEVFFERWTAAHDRAAAKLTDGNSGIRRCVQNRQLPAFNGMLAYFGGKKVPLYEGVTSLWFDSADAERLFRDYEQALRDINADPQSRFFDERQSFFVYAAEVPIFERSQA
ncbi:EthD domain-containing protein [Rhizobium alvei]|uniref:EthD domain-containing protein n=1 Tax=Rhizobium alvei TaxID=1132659 RepID=A0ABT8YTN9_9HYPH|nr:EthD domain-containing protein [Rhizobium alvei]MDO6966727.1 EthD domain-containing protein [Rhizobium alvei]